MRPDLIRLLVDTDRKDSVVEKEKNSGIKVIRTIDRVGLSVPLPTRDEE
jgi:cyanide hydratase